MLMTFRETNKKRADSARGSLAKVRDNVGYSGKIHVRENSAAEPNIFWPYLRRLMASKGEIMPKTS